MDRNLWGTNGNVLAFARSGNTLYIGGAFSQVGPNTGGGIPLGVASGQPVTGYPPVAGQVLAVVPDGSGGWFIGGDFTAVGDVPRSHLAHILAGGQVANWAPDPDATVRALALSGETLYIGGDFNEVGGQPRNRAAAIDITTGVANVWDPSPSGVLFGYDAISALAVRADTVYVGGNFTQIGGQSRSYLAAVDGHSGEALDWRADANYIIRAVTLSGSTAYVGGDFSLIGGQPRRRVAAVNLADGAVTDWDPYVG
ncbi:MAG: hypothetical protein ABIS67_15655, partial [Candidatus Eisenbacteria bacterium]